MITRIGGTTIANNQLHTCSIKIETLVVWYSVHCSRVTGACLGADEKHVARTVAPHALKVLEVNSRLA